MRAYALLGRVVYQLIRPAFPLYGLTLRTRCLLVSGDQILLVKNWLGRGVWTLPGGGVKPREDPMAAMAREIREELSLKDLQLSQLGDWMYRAEGLRGQWVFFWAKTAPELIHPSRREIIAWGWFPISKLPANRTLFVDEALERYRASSTRM